MKTSQKMNNRYKHRKSPKMLKNVKNGLYKNVKIDKK